MTDYQRIAALRDAILALRAAGIEAHTIVLDRASQNTLVWCMVNEAKRLRAMAIADAERMAQRGVTVDMPELNMAELCKGFARMVCCGVEIIPTPEPKMEPQDGTIQTATGQVGGERRDDAGRVEHQHREP